MSVIVNGESIIRPCKEKDCKEPITASISATVYAVGKTKNEKDKRHN